MPQPLIRHHPHRQGNETTAPPYSPLLEEYQQLVGHLLLTICSSNKYCKIINIHLACQLNHKINSRWVYSWFKKMHASSTYFHKPVSCFSSFWDSPLWSFTRCIFETLYRGSWIVFYFTYIHSRTMYVALIEGLESYVMISTVCSHFPNC